MSRYALPELGKKYWESSDKEQYQVWLNLVYRGMHRSALDSERTLNELRELPLDERFYEAAFILADISEGITPTNKDGYKLEGRGPKPILVTGENIARISGAMNPSQQDRWSRRFFDRHGRDFLLTQGLTASNPQEWENDDRVEFSKYDIIHGIYIPTEIDAETVAALGTLYGAGSVMNRSSRTEYCTYLLGHKRTSAFFSDVVPEVFVSAFNIIQTSPRENPQVKHAPNSRFKTYTARQMRMDFSSKAFYTYLTRYINFPATPEEKKVKGISHKIKLLDSDLKEEFVAFFIAAGGNVGDSFGRPNIRMTTTASAVLQDFRRMIRDIDASGAVRINPIPGTNSSTLSIGWDATRELLRRGRLSENYSLKNLIKTH